MTRLGVGVLRALPIGEPRREAGDCAHQPERNRLANQMIEVEGRINRHVENGDAGAGQHLTVQPKAFADELQTGRDENESSDRPLNHPCRFPDPMVLDCQLFEIADADDDRDDADVEQPSRSDSRFQPFDSPVRALAPFDSRKFVLAQGRPFDSRKFVLAQGRPFDSRIQ